MGGIASYLQTTPEVVGPESPPGAWVTQNSRYACDEQWTVKD